VTGDGRAVAARALKLAAAEYGWIVMCCCGRADIADDASCAACDDDERQLAHRLELRAALARIAADERLGR
jgi:hypothetical protein